MYNFPNVLVTIALAASLSTLGACKKDEPAAKTEATETEPAPTEETPAPEETTDGDQSFARGLMSSYEECRALLAADKGEGVSACATAMVSAAKEAAAGAPEGAKEALKEVGTAAQALAKASADDLAGLRLAYGEVSKPIVAVLTAAPEAAKHYHLFECPMAKGYKRWAQPEKKMANPYMGTSMLECGTEIHDHHKAGADAPAAGDKGGAAHLQKGEHEHEHEHDDKDHEHEHEHGDDPGHEKEHDHKHEDKGGHEH
jgi:hypothetical protein